MTVSQWMLVTLASAAFGLLLVWAHVVFWSRRLAVPMRYELDERLPTPDGSAIELRRVPRAAGASTAADRDELPPVVLVHGLASSHRNHDAWAERSLARHLAAEGRDVWLLTLRSGLADWHHRARANVRFEAMAAHDLEAGVRAVLARTGASAVDYVGFSMGGMLLYAAAGRLAFRRLLRRVATIGSPGRLAPALPLAGLVRRLPLALVPALPLRFLSRLSAFASEWVHTPFHHLTCNPRNFAPGAMRLALVNCIEDVPRSLARDFARWSFGDGELEFEGRRVLESLGDCEVPALFLAGSVDRLAPVPAVRSAYEAWGARHDGIAKRLLVLGREHGQPEDYGHGDLAVGARVAEEVFAPVAAFLGDRDGAA